MWSIEYYKRRIRRVMLPCFVSWFSYFVALLGIDIFFPSIEVAPNLSLAMAVALPIALICMVLTLLITAPVYRSVHAYMTNPVMREKNNLFQHIEHTTGVWSSFFRPVPLLLCLGIATMMVVHTIWSFL